MTRVGTVWLDVAVNTEEIGQDLEQWGADFSRNVSAPLLAAGGLAVQQFAGFETSLSRIVGLTGVAQSQVDEWAEDVTRVGVEYGVGAQSAADALYFISSSGLQGAEAIDTLEQSAKAAAAGLGETQVIADLTTSALNAYKGSGLDAARATDILVAAVAEGKGEPAEFAAAMGQVLPIASALGVSYEQVAGAEAAMTLRGLDASEATTALRAILSTLLKPSQQAEQGLAAVGLSSAGLRKQLKEQGLLPTLETLVESMGDNAAATASVFENVRALNGVMNILGVNAGETRRVMDSVANSVGLTDKAFAVASETAEAELGASMEKVKLALIEVGAQIAPTAVAVAGFASGAAEQFDRLPQPVQTTVLAIGGLAAVAGPAAFALGRIVSGGAAAARSMYDFVVALRAGNTAVATTQFGRLGGMLGAIPFRAAAAASAVAALAGAFVILQSKINDARDDKDALKAIADERLARAQSFTELQEFIGKANAETEKLRDRFDEIRFDPVEREQIGALGEALAESATQAAKFSGQAIAIADAMGVSRDRAAEWVLEQARTGRTFDTAGEALSAYQKHLSDTSGETGELTNQTARLAAAAGPLADPFFTLQQAQRGYEQSLQQVVSAQRQAEQAQRGVDAAYRQHEDALRRVSDAEARRRQSLRDVERAQRDVTEAQRALNEALAGPTTDQALNVESAEIGLLRAQERLNDLGKARPGETPEPVSPLDRREAELAVRRAENDLQRARAEIDGRVAVAQDNLRDAQDRLSDSQRQADDAARAVADAHRGVEDAMRGVADARIAAEDATRGIADAQWAAVDAARNLGGAQDALNEALAKGPNLAGPFIGYLSEMKARFPEVSGGIDGLIGKFRELEALAQPESRPRSVGEKLGASLTHLEGRAYGGPVQAGTPYEVTELGEPEVFSDGIRQWMIPPVSGRVVALDSTPVSNLPAGQGGSGPVIVVEHLDVHGPDPVETSQRVVTGLSKKAILMAARR